MLLLGAGLARRFGSDKRLHNFRGKPIAQHTIERYKRVFDKISVVIRPEDQALQDLLHKQGVDTILCQDAHLGMGHSLACAMQAIIQDGQSDWLVVGLLDMPFVRVETLQSLQSTIQSLSSSSKQTLSQPGLTRKSIVRFQSATGTPPTHPVAWHQHWFEKLSQANGDEGARRIFKQVAQDSPSSILWLASDDPGLIDDIDTPADLPNE